MYNNMEHFFGDVVPINGKVVLRTNSKLEEERLDLCGKLLAKYGKVFSKPVAYYVEDDLRSRCFDKAFSFAVDNGMHYVEGVARFVPEGSCVVVSMIHAWCCDDNGWVVDPTMGRHYGEPYVSYLGVPLKIDYVKREYAVNGYVGCIDGRLGGVGGIYDDHPFLWLDTGVSIR